MPEEVKLMNVEEVHCHTTITCKLCRIPCLLLYFCHKRAELLICEIVDGIGESGVRCGLIGEVGCSSPLTENERKSLKAAAIAQQRTGN